jgi:RimJ/RimL family protein N-acetyltransferase
MIAGRSAKHGRHHSLRRPKGRSVDSRPSQSTPGKPVPLERQIDRLEGMGNPGPAQRMTWLRSLHEAAASLDDDSPRSAPLRRRLLRLAQRCDHWPLAAALGESLLDEGLQSADDLTDLAAALWRQGRTADAMAIALKAMLAFPGARGPAALYADLRAWAQALPDTPRLLSAGDLRLEPLGHHHFGDFSWQFDTAVVERCCLPMFRSAQQWQRWLDQNQGVEGQMIYGIWHALWGFCGCVSLTVAGHAGFFYYWLGPDFRGRGIGPQAGKILLRYAREVQGLTACYATAFDTNTDSQRGLARIGFVAVDVPVTRDRYPAETLFRWPASGGDVTDEARVLLEAIGASSRITRLILPGTGRRQAPPPFSLPQPMRLFALSSESLSDPGSIYR